MHDRPMVVAVCVLLVAACVGCADSRRPDLVAYPYQGGVPRLGLASTAEPAALGRLFQTSGDTSSGKLMKAMDKMPVFAGQVDAQQAIERLPIGDQPQVSVQERKLIRDAALVVGVGNVEESVRQAGALAGILGGYVQEATTQRVVLRVPSDRFDDAVDRLGGMGMLVDRTVKARDVTEQYLDLELRLKTKRALLERLRGLFEKAEKVEDILKIEKEISRLTTEVEQLEGKLRMMQNQVAYSKVAVEFVEAGRTAGERFGPNLPFPWLGLLGLDTLIGR